MKLKTADKFVFRTGFTSLGFRPLPTPWPASLLFSIRLSLMKSNIREDGNLNEGREFVRAQAVSVKDELMFQFNKM